MRSLKTCSLLALLSLTLGCAQAAIAQVKPSALFSDHMVLQSGMTVPVWGTAEPEESMTVPVIAPRTCCACKGTHNATAKRPTIKRGVRTRYFSEVM